MYRRSILALLAAQFALNLAGCSQKAPTPVAALPTDRVRNIDLPYARRTGDALSASAPLVLVAFDAISVGGRDVVPLERGAIKPAPPSFGPIAAVVQAVPSGTAEVRVRMHAATHVSTLLAVVASLRSRGVTRIGFDVRKDAMGEGTGTLVPAQLDARAARAEPFRFEPPYGRTWEQIPDVLDDAFIACSTADGSFDCSPVTANVAFGGDAEVSLFRRHNGVILDMRRFGLGNDIPAREGFLQQQNGRSGPMRDRERDRAAVPPISSASFGFRWASMAANPESPLAPIMRALAATGPIGVRISGDGNSDAGSLISMIGAAFPDGVPAPALMLDSQAH